MTTAEVLVGASLSIMVLGVAASFFTAQQRALLVQNTYTESQNVTRTFTDLVGRELRMASYDPAGTALAVSNDVNWCPGTSQGLTEATPTSIRFLQDLNGDGDTSDTAEDVRYWLTGNNINRQEGNTTPLALVTGVPDVGLTFTYYNNSNPPVLLTPSGSPSALTAGQRDCVAKVKIDVNSSIPNPDPSQSAVPLHSAAQLEVALRNRSLMNF